jgi:hypothetical protein
MDINRGDRFDFLVSLESSQFNFEEYAKAVFPSGSRKAKLKVEMGDMRKFPEWSTARYQRTMILNPSGSP